MKKFVIVTNEQRDPKLQVTRSIQDYINMKGGESLSVISRKSGWNDKQVSLVSEEYADADAMIVLGGDGTLVRAARSTAGMNIPLIGVNLGNLGYLCELERSNVFPAIGQLFDDNYVLEERMLVDGAFLEKDLETEHGVALNDIVFHRAGLCQMVNLALTVNGEYLTTYSADGIIISTPTGSTGYSLAAGGPIVDPKAQLILITPINPHSTSSQSIVVGSDAKIEIALVKRRPEQDETVEVTFDGDRIVEMKVGDQFRVQKAAVSAKILKLDRLSFLQILRKKM